MTKRAVLSVSDKTGLSGLARALAGAGWELVATGGTARLLRAEGMPVLDVAEVTGAPEMLGGRVKTLHPAVHAGILARDRQEDRAELAAHGIAAVDLVVCNLYPFDEVIDRPETSEAEALENIDIGGVTLLRAAAKNYPRVTTLCDPRDYETVVPLLLGDGVNAELRRALAAKAFAHTADYDRRVARYLSAGEPGDDLPDAVTLALFRVQSLRYGENPHQTAALYAPSRDAGPLGGRLLQGKELSYNNLLDLDAAWRVTAAFAEPAVAIVKHLSPCGVAVGERIATAFAEALLSDPVSAFGGVLAANREIDEAFTAALGEADLFVEAIAGPAFSDEARGWLAQHKRNCRLVELSARPDDETAIEWRTIRGGMIAQRRDDGDPAGVDWRVVSARPPEAREWSALRFAWVAAQHVKSNAIVLATEQATVGIGGGLPSRVDAVRLAVAKAGARAADAVMASDAFFPFADGIELAAAAGVTAVVQPGGSVRDAEVVAAADRLGLAMVFTGVRHFRH